MGWLVWIENRHALSRSALGSQIGLLGEGRQVMVGLTGVSNRRQCPQCRRANFDPRSALRAHIRAAGEG
jgi:hypothetical protein